MDRHCFDADPDPETIYYFDANPDPDPTFHFDANPDPRSYPGLYIPVC